MSEPARCAACAHHPHPGRPCRVQRVTGPAANVQSADYKPDQHTGRTVTQCRCNIYTTTINGAHHE